MTKHKPAEKAHKSNGRANGHTATLRPQRRATTARHTESNGHVEGKHEKFRGVLEEFNLSPKGGVEGFLLHSDGQTVQVNVTTDVGFAVVRGIGQNVEATVEPEHASAKHEVGRHAVYRLISLTGADGKPLIFDGSGAKDVATVQGVVKRINYDRHGAANGVILGSGDFVYMKPEAMKRAGLKVGDHVTAEGASGMMPLGQRIIEAKTVNGTVLTSKKPVRGSTAKGNS
jgi:hypothetical protein